MSERDEDVLRRYRALGRETPPPSIDAAILAASRDAVRPRRVSRWALPVSAAAVVVLALGVVLEVQHEPSDASLPGQAAQPQSARRPQRAPAPRELRDSTSDAAATANVAPEQKRAERAAGASALRAPAATSTTSVVVTPPPAAPTPSARMAPRAATTEKARVEETPERELERIAAMREAGHDDEADKALEAFRREHADYRIAPAMWERVRKR